ncbi:hypothetical protein FRC01_010041 [Tulasnella sp. 417]|nr:hypothetical protein FRC01_010041 [Tulasnella sp. 417]
MNHSEEMFDEKRTEPIATASVRDLIETWLANLGTTILPTVQATSVLCPLELEQCLLRQLECLSLDCPDHPVEYNDADEVQHVELTINLELLRLTPPCGTRVQLPRQQPLFVQGEEWENTDRKARGSDAEDDEYRLAEGVEISGQSSLWWTLEHQALHCRGGDDSGSSDRFTSEEDSASTQAPASSSSSILFNSHAFEVSTVYSDSDISWRAERASNEVGEDVVPSVGRFGCAEPRDVHEASDMQVAASPGESAYCEAGAAGGSDGECAATLEHFELGGNVAERVSDVRPAWELVPRALIDEAVRPVAGSCATRCELQLLELEALILV